MNRYFLYAFLLCLTFPCRAAVILSIDPLSQNVALGSPASFNLNISGLGSGIALGTYDIDIGFNSSLLSYDMTTFGNQLDLFGLGDIQTVTTGAGKVNLFELSLDSTNDLNNLQSHNFTLATLIFNTLATGENSPITLSVNALGNADGNSISANLDNGSVSINAVPIPGSTFLFVTGLMVLIGFRSVRMREPNHVYSCYAGYSRTNHDK